MSDLPPPTPPEPPPPEPAASSPPPEQVAPPPPSSSSPAADFFSKIPPSEWAGDPTPKDSSEKTLGLVMHLLQLSGFIFAKFPFVGIIAPLVLWLVKRGESPYLDAMGKEVINFQINIGVLGVIGFILCFVCIGIPLLIALGITALVLIIMASIQVNEGKFYRYPWIYRVIK